MGLGYDKEACLVYNSQRVKDENLKTNNMTIDETGILTITLPPKTFGFGA
jgi:hypothetical protein